MGECSPAVALSGPVHQLIKLFGFGNQTPERVSDLWQDEE